MGTLLLLALTLSLDSLRASVALGATRLSTARQLKFALVFGVCDGLAPPAGLLVGHAVADSVGAWTDRIGPLLLVGYGLYVTYIALRCADRADGDWRWIVWGIPVSLSLDNLIAGASLGRLGFPVPVSASVIGLTSALMSLVGLRLASATVERLRIRTELVGGIALVVIALTLAG